MFQLPALPYDFDALEPVIDAQTMQIHYSKHHQGYVDKLNAALQSHEDLFQQSVEELVTNLHSLPQEVQTAVRNNGGGHANHSLFWSILSVDSEDQPTGKLAAAIDSKFGSVDEFKQEFESATAGQFGSGWGWLVVNPQGDLEVATTANQDSPLTAGKTPIFGVDVWEHAYYLNYQNRRAEYLSNIWQIVDWSEVARRFEQALS